MVITWAGEVRFRQSALRTWLCADASFAALRFDSSTISGLIPMRALGAAFGWG